MIEKRCIITGQLITNENDSEAHVIPSALGGRLKPLGILCKDANLKIGDKIDLPLIKAFQAVMSLLNASRDRGNNQPVKMTDNSGDEYSFQFGEPLKATKPVYSETLIDDRLHVQISASSKKEARTLLGRVRKKIPNFDVDEAMTQATTEQRWPDGMLKFGIEVGPRSVFPEQPHLSGPT
ncbi:HNH endonuclease [Pseudophaeobacter sp.]|uniref:HNH endonuclease n=1 Tax=Pseudophaeobacter sp. TaxID=1971739 RepID=UPI00329993BC